MAGSNIQYKVAREKFQAFAEDVDCEKCVIFSKRNNWMVLLNIFTNILIING